MTIDINSVRGRNMQKRRARILAEARGLLAAGGFEALNLRELARSAEVTVPTIYNLIGKKEEVLLALAAGVVSEVETRINPTNNTDPISLATAVVEESVQLFREDEAFYRAAFLAVEWLDHVPQQHQEVARLFAWVGSLLRPGISACREAGLLRGRVPVEAMTKLSTRNYRMNCRGWALGHCSLDEFRDHAICDLYIVLAADAVDRFHAHLLRKISEHQLDEEFDATKEKMAEKN